MIEIDREALARDTSELEGAEAAAILRWASARFAPNLTFATSLGMEDGVVLDMIARHALPVAIFTLDTGLLFPETYALKAEIERKYGLTITPVQPLHTVEEQAARVGLELLAARAGRVLRAAQDAAAARDPREIRRLDHRDQA